MKLFDLFCPSQTIIHPIFIGLLVCYAGTSMADAQPVETFPSDPLILNLSDQWLEPRADLDSALQKPSQTTPDTNLAVEKSATRKTNIGCNMDVSSLPVSDDSITSRLEGRCNLDYRY